VPVTSCFTPCGLLSLSSKQCEAQSIYNAILNSLGNNFATAAGTYHDAWAYCHSMRIARKHSAMVRAGNQGLASKVHELLPVAEESYGLTPGGYDTEATRTGALVARTMAPAGGTQGNIYAALRAVLGASLLSYHPLTYAESVKYPATLGAQPMFLADPFIPRKLGTLYGSVSGAPSSQTVAYTVTPQPQGLTPVGQVAVKQAQYAYALNTNIQVGDFVVVEPDVHGITEVVEVEAVGFTDIGADDALHNFTAEFTYAHSPGATVVVMH
jgi:hypothetical protein